MFPRPLGLGGDSIDEPASDPRRIQALGLDRILAGLNSTSHAGETAGEQGCFGADDDQPTRRQTLRFTNSLVQTVEPVGAGRRAVRARREGGENLDQSVMVFIQLPPPKETGNRWRQSHHRTSSRLDRWVGPYTYLLYC